MRHTMPFSKFAMEGSSNSRQVQYPVDLGRFTSSQASTNEDWSGLVVRFCMWAAGRMSCSVTCERGWQGWGQYLSDCLPCLDGSVQHVLMSRLQSQQEHRLCP